MSDKVAGRLIKSLFFVFFLLKTLSYFFFKSSGKKPGQNVSKPQRRDRGRQEDLTVAAQMAELTTQDGRKPCTVCWGIHKERYQIYIQDIISFSQSALHLQM